MITSERTSITSSGRISGTGFASAKRIGFDAIDATISLLITPRAESPTITSAPRATSASVRGWEPCAKTSFHSSMSSLRPRWTSPYLSHIQRFPRGTPSLTYCSAQATAAAPAPTKTTFTSVIFFPTSYSALINAAPVMIAVPC